MIKKITKPITATIAIDPGSVESAYVLCDSSNKIIDHGKILNNELLTYIYGVRDIRIDHVVIEQIASYGMAVGATVFDTVQWTGRFIEAAKGKGYTVSQIKRKEVVVHLCGSPRAKDTNVVQALIDRFAGNSPNMGKGTKKDPGIFYGFRKDIWQAFAVAVAWHDLKDSIGEDHYVK